MVPAAKAARVSHAHRAGGPGLPLRENGPALLVPAAWGVAAGAVLGVVSSHALFVAHVVMSALLVAFVAASWRDMATGVLRAWKLVILAGTPVTLAGVAGFLARDGTVPALAGAVPADALLAVAFYGWMLLPAPAFVYTGLRDPAVPRSIVQYVAAACSVAGAAVAALAGSATGTVAGIALVGAGQTAGILAATALYSLGE
ncbi:hypothetical protein C465_14806 [Halorubrum distributum JCM 9100]|uniref:Uncharacterized protein n=4 Tax=Halorubrum distributum TaxID=29283 RepID=M0EDR2_9EURY|nr:MULTISPECIES: hypothetical protein [Halorubrum distributum group]ELZ45203.1 hypothetical protein C465_14806 [Halorubrum distributum JCM 9100]ELZ50868.1 hypothetical protein C466_14371 [Halorubrum distributum JCM 10118]EMA60764.1 hypothetical protein C470_08678 [Halorubrum litoreum JCM 13561]MYL66999.1 hypothetical protein [Halorubrum terrestre]